MKFDFEKMKQEREEYDKDTFNKILEDIHRQIKENNSVSKNTLSYNPEFTDSNVKNLNYKWNKRNDLKKYVFVLKNEGFKVKIKHPWDSGEGWDESYYYLHIEW